MAPSVRRRREPPVLRRFPGEPGGDVRVDAVGRGARVRGPLRRGGRAGRAARVGRLRRLARLGVAERRLPPVLGDGAGVLPAVPRGVPRHDDQRAAEPRALPALPGARRALALLARPAQQPGGLPGLRPVRAAAARPRLGGRRPGRRRGRRAHAVAAPLRVSDGLRLCVPAVRELRYSLF